MKKASLSLELKVGIFIVIAIIAILLFIFTQVKRGEYRGYEIGALFDYVSGLETGSPVRVSGVRAGEVRNIEILYDVKPKVLARLRLRKDVKLGIHSIITIQTLGIIGEKYIEITPSSEKKYIRPGEIVEGENPLSMEKLAEASQSIVVRLNDVLLDVSRLMGDEQIQENIKTVINNSAAAINRIENTFEKMSELTDTVAETNKKAQALLIRNGPEIEKLINNTNELVISTRTKMEDTLDEIKRFASAGTDAAQSFKDIRETALVFKKTASGIQSFLSRLQNEGLVAKMLEEEELFEQIKHEIALLHDATQQFKKTVETINDVSENMDVIVSDLRKGEGTAGKFLRSDEMYKDISDFIKDIKAHPWKIFIRRE
jgi:phospholipid/cholesterol/gamma-HCH transport system substrate-binding protein